MPWTAEEDAILAAGRAENHSWNEIAPRLPGRTAKACIRRWDKRHTKSGPWSDSEFQMLMAVVQQHSDRFKEVWKEVAKELGNGRTWQMCEKKAMEGWNRASTEPYPRNM